MYIKNETSLSSIMLHFIVDNINLIKCQYYKNIDNNTLQLYVNNNLSDYDSDNNVTDNDYIMLKIFRYYNEK